MMLGECLRISPYPAYSHSSISSFFTWAQAADSVDDPSPAVFSSSKKSLLRTVPLVGSFEKESFSRRVPTQGTSQFSAGLLSFSKDSSHVVGCSIVLETWSSFLYDPEP